MADQIGGTVVWNLDVDKTKLTQGLSGAADDVRRAGKDIEGSVGAVEGRLGGLGAAFKNAEAGSKLFAGSLLAVGAAGAGIAGFGLKFAADIETMTQGFVTLLGSTEKANAAIEMIKKDAASTPFEIRGLILANQQLTSITKDANESERFLLNVGKALSAMGRGQPELDRIITNLQQIGAVGHASMVDIRQFAFAGIPIFEMLGEAAKKTGGNVEDMIKNHEITFEFLKNLFAEAGEGSGRFARAFTEQAGTFNQLMSNFKDNIGIAASEIVKQTGVFDAVKRAFGAMIQFIGDNTPTIVAIIRTMFEAIANNGPIVVGVIIGGLVPAFTALAVSIGAAMIPLLPFIAAGAALGLVVKLLVDQMGGWGNATAALGVVMGDIVSTFNEKLLPSLQFLWGMISNQLLPALRDFWTVAGPLLGPVLKALAQVVGAVLVIALQVLIQILIQAVNFFTTVIRTVTAVISAFVSLANGISSVMSGVYRAITQPFVDAWNTIRDYTNRIRDALNNINPFARHSPSLVDNVMRGVDVITKEFKSLANLALPPISAAGAGGLYAPSILNSGASDIGGGGRPAPVSVNIAQANINDKQDIDAIGREIGFRIGLAK